MIMKTKLSECMLSAQRILGVSIENTVIIFNIQVHGIIGRSQCWWSWPRSSTALFKFNTAHDARNKCWILMHYKTTPAKLWICTVQYCSVKYLMQWNMKMLRWLNLLSQFHIVYNSGITMVFCAKSNEVCPLESRHMSLMQTIWFSVKYTTVVVPSRQPFNATIFLGTAVLHPLNCCAWGATARRHLPHRSTSLRDRWTK